MPGEKYVSIKEFAPKAHYAICELVGGEDRLVDWCKSWSDAFILNLGRADYNPADKLDLRQLEQWHVDGDFFTHFLDSPEQALLVVPLFTDIPEKGGGTAICTDGIGAVAKHLVSSFSLCIAFCHGDLEHLDAEPVIVRPSGRNRSFPRSAGRIE